MVPRALVVLLLLAPLATGDAQPPGVADVADALRAEADRLPLAALAEIGRSREGRPIHALLAGVPSPRPLADRPRLMVVAGLRPDHRIGTAVALGLADALLARAAADPARAAVLADYALEVVPLVNPDGLAALLAGPERDFRTNLRPLDDDRDGRVDEDGPDDLDGDGRITTLRIPDPAGGLLPSSEDPRVLVGADPARFERGLYRVETEGLDNDGDGLVNEDGPGGVDLERNFPHGGDRYDPRRGPGAPSEPETIALADHLLASPRTVGVLVYGTFDTLSAPPAPNRAQGRAILDGPLPEDLPVFAEASRLYAAAGNRRGRVDDAPAGAFHQWVHYHRGLYAFATPLFPGPDPEGLTLPSGAAPQSGPARLLAWSDARWAGRGFTPWTPFAHPTLGAVEVGGFAPRLEIEPPADLYGPIAVAQGAFVADLLAALPRPVLRDVRAAPLAPGAFEVRAVLANAGRLPLTAAMGERTRAVAPFRVTIAAPGALLAGEPRTLVLRPPGDVREFRWVIAGAPGDKVEVRVESDRFGRLVAEVTL